jgi:RNA polymerase sigma-70 factor (ECF subfamily)
MNTTPVSLLERLRQPAERAAWGRFVQLYTPLLFYWARRMGLADADAADLVQDVFTLLIQKLPEFTYDRHKSFRNWLKTVTLNKWRDQQRQQAARLGEARQVPLPDLPSPDHAEAFWEAEYRRQLVGRALEVMQAEFQPATWKACWEFVACGRPASEVAAELGLSENAVYIAKCRVLRRLRQELDGLME